MENSFSITPTFLQNGGGPGSLSDGAVTAKLRIANFGSATNYANAGWNQLVNENNIDPVSKQKLDPKNGVDGVINFECKNGATGLNICDTVKNDKIQGRSDLHQCLQAELRQTDPKGNVVFGAASAYTNMFYEHLSESVQYPEISVAGLQAILGNSNNRDVYLRVVKRNLPLPGTTKITPDVKGLSALRAQVDPSYYDPSVTCDQDPADRCMKNANGAGTCMHPAVVLASAIYCQSELNPVNMGAQGWWCPIYPAEACTIPAGGGVDSNVSSLTMGQKARDEFPNIEVFPYVATGKIITINGVQKKQLVPIPSFGIFYTHDLPFYGFLSSLVEEYQENGQTKVRELKKIKDDLFMITVPNEKFTRLRMTVSTQDSEPSTLFQIVGTATPLPLGLGNMTMTGTARTRSIDLSKASVTIESLLKSGTTELVANLGAPLALTRNAGATASSATFSGSRWFGPSVTMQVVKLPLIGQVITMQVIGASVNLPTTCPLSIGLANLKTAFTITDNAGAVSVSGTDQWGCVPAKC